MPIISILIASLVDYENSDFVVISSSWSPLEFMPCISSKPVTLCIKEQKGLRQSGNDGTEVVYNHGMADSKSNVNYEYQLSLRALIAQGSINENNCQLIIYTLMPLYDQMAIDM